MPSLEAYDRDAPYSYAPGLFPAITALTNAPERVSRVLLSTQGHDSAGVRKLCELAHARGVRVEEADRLLRRLSGKENCYAAAVFEKACEAPRTDGTQVVLHHPSDMGNLGTIFRACLGFGVRDLTLVAPCADPFDPRVVRASMGAIFSLRLCVLDSMEAFCQTCPDVPLYPFMLDGAVPLSEAAKGAPARRALVFGNEGAGLPASFARLGQAVRIEQSEDIDSLNLAIAVAVGVYAFSQGGQPPAQPTA